MLETIATVLFIYVAVTWIVVSLILRIRHIGSYNQHAIDELTYAIKVLRKKIEALENAQMSGSHQPIKVSSKLNEPTETVRYKNASEFVNKFYSESEIQLEVECSDQELTPENVSLSNPEPDTIRKPSHLPKPALVSENNAHPEISQISTIATPSLWQKIEKQIAYNWTGIIGTMVLVLGVGFLGIYTALKMNEFFRFLLVIGCSFIMNGVFIAYRHTEKWKKLALWMRSASGAVFLFACLGAGGIPGLH